MKTIDKPQGGLAARLLPRAASSVKRSTPRGWVYFLWSDYGIKIGRTKNPIQRVRGFETSFPCRTKLLGCIRVGNASSAEKFLHELFDADRLGGEWFALTPDELFDRLEGTGRPTLPFEILFVYDESDPDYGVWVQLQAKVRAEAGEILDARQARLEAEYDEYVKLHGDQFAETPYA